MRRIIFIVSGLVLVGSWSLAYEGPKGAVILLERCPGDEATKITSPHEALFPALLTPILTGVVSQGLKTAGERLKAEAQEAQIEVLHAGDYFYRYMPGPTPQLDLKHRCVIVATRGALRREDALASLTKEYKAKKADGTWIPHDPNSPDTNPLAVELVKGLGLDAENPDSPGAVAVFDLELSIGREEARLVPRYVAVDHSVREARHDDRVRTFTFEFTISSPVSVFGKPLLKVDISSPKPIVSPTSVASDWFALPEPGAKVKTRLEHVGTATKTIKVEESTANLAREAAVQLGGTPTEDCPASGAVLERWRDAFARLEVEKSNITKENPNLKAVSLWTHMVTFYDSCRKKRAAEAELDANEFKQATDLRPFDLQVAIKEFRKRPAAQFFGSMLADDTTRAGITSSVINALDPATRAAAAKAEEVKQTEALEALESALVAAESAIAAYEAAAPEAKASAFIDMEAKKRTANRLAQRVEQPLPYPEAGTWFK